MNLQNTILNECREEVAKRDYNTPFGYVVENGTFSSIMRLIDEATELALERQADFFRHIFFIGWRVVDNVDGQPIYEQGKQSPQATELELYQIWREGKDA